MNVAVVGAGIVGGAIAFHLARRGAEVTLIDAGEPGMGATSHSFAWINSFGKEPRHYGALNRRALDTWDRFARLLDADIGLRWGGQLTWAATDEEADALARKVAGLQSWGYAARMIDQAEMLRLEPGLKPGTVKAAAYSDNDGHVQGTLVAHTCASRVQQLGGSVVFGNPVTDLVMHGGRVTEVQLAGSSVPDATMPGDSVADASAPDASVAGASVAGASVACDAVVLAAGVATTRLAQMAGVHVPQEESPGVVVRTEPLPPVLCSVAALYAPRTRHGGRRVHLRQSTDGIVMIGEGSQESLARDDSPRHAAELLARATVYLPELASATPVPVPVGYRPMPVGGLPVLGYTRAVPNLYLALMHSGITLAPLVGELATMEILDGARVDILDHYRPERFDRAGGPGSRPSR